MSMWWYQGRVLKEGMFMESWRIPWETLFIGGGFYVLFSWKIMCGKGQLRQSIFAVNKQINDKERIAAAMENPNLKEIVENCLKEPE